MKKIDITQIVSPASKQPFTANSLDFLQKGNKEMISAICLNIISNNGLTYSGTTPYLITNGNLISPLSSDGAIFYGGELYIMLENTGLTYAVIDTTPDTSADPLTFTDGINKNVHNNRYLDFTNTATGSLFAVANIVNVTGTNTTTLTFLNSWTASESVLVYKSKSNKIEFKGSISKSTTSGGIMFNLPTEYRPSVQRNIPITILQSSTVIQNVLIVETLGNCYLLNTPSATSTLAILNGINFYL